MKRRVCTLLLAFTLMLNLLPVSASATEESGTTKVPKILVLGNSYTVNVMTYLNHILLADESVKEFTLGYLYRAGCTLKMHASYAKNDSAKYTYYKCETSATKSKATETTLLTALQDEDWDIIYLQQASGHSPYADKYTEYLNELINYINKNKTNPEAKFGWHMTWSYAPGYATSGNTYSESFAQDFQGDPLLMYNAISDVVQNTVMTKKDFVSMIPSGTAIQNARTSYFGDTLNAKDCYHLGDLGKVITGYTWYSCLTGKPVETVDLAAVPLSDMDKIVVMEAANNAVSNPYTVTQSAYTVRKDPRALNLTCAVASVGGRTVTSAVQGEQVTLTYTVSNDELAFKNWKITSGNIVLDDPSSPTTTFTMPDEDVTIEAEYTNMCPSLKMKDVSLFQWYHKAVDYVLTNGIMGGYSAEKFGPNDNLSRAMVVQVLYNKEGTPEVTAENKFPDVGADQWYCKAVRWAADKGVVGGYGDGRFGPDDNVTIEQVAVILNNYAGKPSASADLASVGKYDDWAAGALQWAVANGILKDVPFTDATENATRAQTAQMLMNYLEK